MDSDMDFNEGSDDEYYNDDDEGGYPSDQDNDMDDTDESEDMSTSKPDYTVLSDVDIQRLQEEDVTRISSVLSVSKVSACNLLVRYNWSAAEVEEAWFDNEEKVRAAVGLLEDPVVDYADYMAVKCRICLDKYRRREMYAAACGHPFCGVCWKSYISISISDGPGCLTLACPEPRCRAAVGQDMVNLLVSEEYNKKYARYLIRSYVEGKRKIKWCPAPGCDYAVDFGSGGYDVSCKCSYSFCWNCSEEAHRPVDCDTVEKWNVKNSAESENVTWILANSKACPKCRRPIEKNHGCMHMTCTPPCKFEFCWLCLGAWDSHGERTGGFFACNSYDKAKKEGKYDEAEKMREMAKNALERYTHYFERWAANQKSRKKAIGDLEALQKDHILKRKEQSLALLELDFITEAWQQIIECRRVLKWTYAYGYYLPVHERAKTQLFEYLQGQAESGLERLHQCAEKELGPHLNADCRSPDFPEFRSKLAGLTSVTKNYFENLMHALENGLADVGHAGKVRLVEERDIEN